MLNPIVSCGIYAFDMLIIYVLFSRIALKKLPSVKCFILGIVIFELGSVSNLIFQNNIAVNTIISLLIRIFYGYLCFDFKRITIICYSFVLVVLNLALELFSVFLISAITGSQVTDYNNNLALLLLESSFCKIVFFLTCLLISHFIVPDGGRSKYQLTLLLYPLFSGCCLMIFWYIATQPTVTAKIQYMLAYSGIIIFASSIMLFIIYQRQTESDREHIRMKSENERLQTEKSYYDILEQQNHNLMIYAHDAKKHLNAIQALNTDPAIDKYLSALLNQLASYTQNCHSGNMMLDVMVDRYAMDCDRLGVKFDYYVKSCNLSNLEDIDMVAILGNLLDNALASAATSESKFVSLETTVRNGYDVVIISNSCDVAPQTHGGHLLTSKADKKLHGFGLKSVSKALKKYRGDYHWDYDAEKHSFVVTAMITQKHK